MIYLSLILASGAACFCFFWAAKLGLRDGNRNDGCWNKLPGHIRKADQEWWRKKRKKSEAGR